MYQREIIYLDLLHNHGKEKNAGFLKIEKKEKDYFLSMQLKNLTGLKQTSLKVRLQTDKGWQEKDNVFLENGSGKWEMSTRDEIYQIEVLISDADKVVGQRKNMPKQQAEPVEVKQQPKQEAEPIEAKQQEQQPEPVEAIPTEPEKLIKSADCPVIENVPLYEDKWEQLLATYEKIHPYGDTRTYIKLEPKDFIVFHSNYQHLVNNSFLLHGFYNYRYLILGKEKDFYLGVPGVFYEREKMVALMFGFEAFECDGGIAEEGKFGYYLRKVEL